MILPRRAFDDSDIATLRLLVSEDVLVEHERAKSWKRYPYMYNLDNLVRSQSSGFLWARARHSTNYWNFEVGTMRTTTLDDIDLAHAIEDGEGGRRLVCCSSCRSVVVVPVVRSSCGHVFCSPACVRQGACSTCEADCSDTTGRQSFERVSPPMPTLGFSMVPGIVPGWAFDPRNATWNYGAPEPAASSRWRGLWRRWGAFFWTVGCFGFGSFLGAFADKNGGNDLATTLIAVGTGKVLGQSAICCAFRAPLLSARGRGEAMTMMAALSK